MARERLTEEQVKAAFAELAQAGGGEIGHNELVTQLEQSGRGAYVKPILALARGGGIGSIVRSQSEGKPVLVYFVKA